jgi:glutamyl-tRNA reductase
VLSRLFHTAIRVGRRARSQTHIGRHAVSVSSTAVALARSTLDDLSGKTVLVVSAGEAGKLTARSLAESGVANMLVTSRNSERAAELAADLGGEAVPYEDLANAVAVADIVMTSTSSPACIIDRAIVERAMAQRPSRPLLLIDIAVPRDIDPAAAALPGVHLANIDDLQAVAQANIHLRRKELSEVERIVDEEAAKFSAWLRSLEVVPTIAALRARADEIRVEEVERTLAKTSMSAADRKRIESMTSAIVKKLLHDPIQHLKTTADGERYVEATRALFDLEDAEAPGPPSNARRRTRRNAKKRN